MQKWEYLTLNFRVIGTPPHNVSMSAVAYAQEQEEVFQGEASLSFKNQILNKMGAQGWELVGLREDIHVFKRPISN
jgi:hypothetical protein